MNLNRREFLILLGGVLTACATTSREPDYTVVIHRDMTFAPSSLVVARGSLIAWHNRADSVHTITADPEQAQTLQQAVLPPNAQPFDSGDLFPGERWVYAFDIPGTYIYFSRYHAVVEMIGTITVSE